MSSRDDTLLESSRHDDCWLTRCGCRTSKEYYIYEYGDALVLNWNWKAIYANNYLHNMRSYLSLVQLSMQLVFFITRMDGTAGHWQDITLCPKWKRLWSKMSIPWGATYCWIRNSNKLPLLLNNSVIKNNVFSDSCCVYYKIYSLMLQLQVIL